MRTNRIGKCILAFVVILCILGMNLPYVAAEDGQTTVTVSNTQELLENVAPNTEIILEAGTYDLLNPLVTTNPYISYGYGDENIIFHDLYNFSMKAQIGANVELLIAPRYSYVLTFTDCSNINLEGLIIGHYPDLGECGGGVLQFTNCSGIWIELSELFGCGTEGLDLTGVTDFWFNSSIIRDCTYGIMTVRDSSNINFENSGLTQNGSSDWSSQAITLMNSSVNIGRCGINFNSANSLSTTNFMVLDNTSSANIENAFINDNSFQNLANSAGQITYVSCEFSGNTFDDGYTVTFDSTGGSTVPSAQVPAGCRMFEPDDDPTFGNLYFAGWYQDEACTIPWSFDVDVVTEGITLYADWSDESLADDFEYIVDNGEVYINKYIGTDVAVNVPSMIDGFPVTRINTGAFSYNGDLVSVAIPDSIAIIEDLAFLYCFGLSEIIVGSGNPNYSSIDGILFNKDITKLLICPSGNPRTSYTVPSSVTEIHDYAFMICSNLTTILIPNELTSIGSSAFQSSGITSINIPEKVSYIGADCFVACSNLIEIIVSTFNNEYATVNGVLFNKLMTTLIAYPSGSTRTTYVVPEGVINIADRAFFYCNNLTNVSLGNSVTYIGDEAFAWCEYIIELVTTNNLVHIGTEAFAGCSDLERISIPSGVNSIGQFAFIFCESLVEISVDTDNLLYSSDEGVLYDKAKLILVCYPSGKLNLSYTIPSTVIYIEEWAFSNSRNLRSVSIPESVSRIEDRSFYQSGLSSVLIPDSVTEIGFMAFNSCENLESVTLSGNLTTIDDSAFSNCSKLLTISIPETVSGIGYFAFDSCSSLQSAYFHGNAPEMGYGVFQSCASVFTVYYHEDSTGFTSPTWEGYPTQTFMDDCQIKYDKNGGDTDAVPQIIAVDYNTTAIMPNSNPTRSGYTFIGWNTKADGTGIAFTPSTIVVEDLTVYAQWLQIPNNVKAISTGYNSAKVTWSAVSGASGYEVYRKLWSSGTYALVGSPTSNSLADTGLSTNKSYYYKVRAYKMVGSVKVFSGDSAVASVIPIPSVPTNIKAISGGYDSAQVSWTAVSGASGYEVWRKLWSSGTFSLVSTQTATSLTNTGLSTNKTYYFKVRAYRLVGTTKVYGLDSAVVSATPIPSTPTGLKAVSTGYNSAKVTWTAVAGASGYEVYRKLWSSGVLSLVSTQTGTSFSNSGLATNKSYFYLVRAYRLVGTTKVYSKDSVFVTVTPVPSAPTGLTVVSGGSKTAKITWTGVSGASGYEVWRKMWSTGTYAIVSTQTATSMTNSGLAVGKTYYYKVRAYRMVGTTKVYGPDSVVVSFTPLS